MLICLNKSLAYTRVSNSQCLTKVAILQLKFTVVACVNLLLFVMILLCKNSRRLIDLYCYC